MVYIALKDRNFNPWQELDRHCQNPANSGQGVHNGANAVFVGTMRNQNEGNDIQSLFLEHYPVMTEKELLRIAHHTKEKWALSDVLILHRIGHIMPGDSIVLVAVWSSHRLASFEGCREIMEDLKQKAPFWKCETLLDGRQQWVSQNTPGQMGHGLGAASAMDQ